MTGAARQVHLFNIPFGVARESNSLHSKRIKESSNQAHQKSPTSRLIRQSRHQQTTNLVFQSKYFQTKEGANDATQGERGVAGRSEDRQRVDFDRQRDAEADAVLVQHAV